MIKGVWIIKGLLYIYFDFRYVTLDIYIYIICDLMGKCNNEFILMIYIAPRKMADFERYKLEIGLEFRHLSFDKRKNFSEGSSEPKKYAQVIRVRGAAAPQVYLFLIRMKLIILLSFEIV